MKKLKKGFTIIELVIVIAVIGILATVLIPTFSTVIHKARVSSDEQAVRNMNTALQTASVYEDIESIEQVHEILAQSGFGKKSYTSTTENTKFVWIKNTSVIAHVDTKSQKITFPKEYAGVTATDENSIDLDQHTYTDPNRLFLTDGPEAQNPSYDASKYSYGYPSYYNNPETKKIDIFTFRPSDDGVNDVVFGEQREKYSNWLADFAIILNDDFAPNTVGICGCHKFYNGWVEIVPGEAEAELLKKGNVLLLLRDILQFGNGLEYSFLVDLCTGNDDGFHCGAFNLSDENVGKSITVQLRLYEPDGNGGLTGRYYVCNEVEYPF